jgi:hypothetical protein
MPVYRINGKNILFIHVPKTGGTSVERFLSLHSDASLQSEGKKLLKPTRGGLMSRSLPLQHFHAEILRNMFSSTFFDYAFLIVRDPLQRLASEYRHSVNLGHVDAKLGFNSWSALMLALACFAPHLRNNHFLPQFEFHCFDAEIFRFEDGMDSILIRLAERLGVENPRNIPHERKVDFADVTVSTATEARVKRVFAKDYASFGYE